MGEREGNRPRIGLVINSLRPGGAERVLVDLLRQYGRTGAWEFVVISLESGGELRSVIEAGGWPVVELGVLRRLNISAVWRLAACLKRERISLVHAHLPRAGVLARLAAVLVGIPCAYTEHNVWPCYHTLTRPLNRVTLPLCACVTAVSQNVITSMGAPARKVGVLLVRNGINVVEARERVTRSRSEVRGELGIPEDAVLAVNVAHIRPEKGHPLLLAAAAQVCKANPAIHFVLIGLDFGRRAPLEEEIARLSLSGNVHYLGFRSDVADIVNASDLFVLSSLQEGMPLSLLEAMALGKPAVVTDAGGNAEVVEQGCSGYVVPPGDPNQLAEAILRLSAATELRTQFGAAARCQIESNFSLRKSATQYEAIYRNLIAHSTSNLLATKASERTPKPSAGEKADIDGCRAKVVYVLPQYREGASEHYNHLVPFLEAVAERTDLVVVVERGSGTPTFARAREIHVLRFGKWPLTRMLELAILLGRLRLRGYRRVFVRISVPSALAAALVGRVIGMNSYYWSSGQAKNVAPSWTGGLKSFLRRLRFELAFIPFYIAVRLVHHVVTGPESMGAYYTSFYGVNPRKIVLLDNDIDEATFFANVRPDDRVTIRSNLGLTHETLLVLFVGRVSNLKGGRNLLPLAERILPKCRDAAFVIVGPVYLSDFVADLACHPFRSRIHVVGPVPTADVASYYESADVLVLPSESEGFPHVVLEAMAAGLPFVAFNVGGVCDIVHPDHLPYVVPRGDLDTFARLVIELLGDAERRVEVGALGRDRVKRYATSRVADAFVQRIAEWRVGGAGSGTLEQGI